MGGENENTKHDKRRGAASVKNTITSINKTCKTSGKKYAQYSCKTVSWDDVGRGTVGGGLSCWGSNITDTYLKSKDGKQLFTVRPDNWNEKLGCVGSGEVALLVGNHERGGGPLKPITLKDFLKNAGKYGEYAKLGSETDLSDDALDKKVSIRFQTTFLPVDDANRAKMEFATEAYNYNTRSDSDPRNLVLLATTQGTAVRQDGQGKKRLYHHAVARNGTVHDHWLEAERSCHKVGGAQKETKQERKEALSRGKAVSSVIGVKSMGTRFNVLMTVQVPLKQKPRERFRGCGYGGYGVFGGGGYAAPPAVPELEYDWEVQEECLKSLSAACESLSTMGATLPIATAPKKKSTGTLLSAFLNRSKRLRKSAPPRRGTANAARVSRGSSAGVFPGLTATHPKRHESEHVTVTVVIYNTVAGGVPSEGDVLAAIDDMEQLYASCAASGKLAEKTFNFMKTPLAVDDVATIKGKLQSQPAVNPPTNSHHEIHGHDTFPVSEAA